VAAGILKRLADLEESREKSLAARRTLKLTALPTTASAEVSLAPNPLYTAGALHDEQNQSPAVGDSPPHVYWERNTDGTDVWFTNIETGRAEWDLPEGAVLKTV